MEPKDEQDPQCKQLVFHTQTHTIILQLLFQTFEDPLPICLLLNKVEGKQRTNNASLVCLSSLEDIVCNFFNCFVVIVLFSGSSKWGIVNKVTKHFT
jgi:hypothetical protein